MRICEMCGVEHNRNSKYCSISCYFKNYYNENKERIDERKKQWHKEHYIRHPKPKKTPEEIKETRKKYVEEHKEYYRQKHREYYLKHKNDKDYIEKIRKNQKKYFNKLKEEKKRNKNGN